MPVLIQNQENAGINGFDKRPEDAGRPLKIYTILKRKGYSKDDINACFGELLHYTASELEELIENKEAPVISLIIAKHLKSALENGNYEKGVMDMLNRFGGMPIQQIKQEMTGNLTPQIVLRDEEAVEQHKKMEEM